MKLAKQLTDLIGNTPLLQLNHINPAIWAKLESFNPQGSVKDRAAFYMIEAAEKEGLLHPGSLIIEPTSGNTGIGIAMIGTARGYDVVLTMPESMSKERRMLLAAYGAKLVLTPAAEGMVRWRKPNVSSATRPVRGLSVSSPIPTILRRTRRQPVPRLKKPSEA